MVLIHLETTCSSALSPFFNELVGSSSAETHKGESFPLLPARHLRDRLDGCIYIYIYIYMIYIYIYNYVYVYVYIYIYIYTYIYIYIYIYIDISIYLSGA